jgi:hypothetical protein
LALIAGGNAIGSLALGNTLTLKSHYDFVRSLNNLEGFSMALEHIQKKTGPPPSHGPVGPIITRVYNVEDGLHGNIEDRPGD